MFTSFRYSLKFTNGNVTVTIFMFCAPVLVKFFKYPILVDIERSPCYFLMSCYPILFPPKHYVLSQIVVDLWSRVTICRFAYVHYDSLCCSLSDALEY